MILTVNEEFNIKEAVKRDINLIDSRLDQYTAIRQPEIIWEAMRYSLLSGGKRIRPLLMLESARICGGNIENVIPAACAIEMLHAQSLIHDDLPCMDDDDYRRGKPSNHKAYGEATAVLAGDALLAYAPQVIINHTPEEVDRKALLMVLDEFLKAAGPMGIVGGQIVDIQSENKNINKETLDYIFIHKTGVLFRLALRAGAILSQADIKKLDALTIYGEKMGYAFQIADDILDVTGSCEELGKTPGKDQKAGKTTYVSMFGLEKAKLDLENLISLALKSLEEQEIKSDFLTYTADNILKKVSKW